MMVNVQLELLVELFQHLVPFKGIELKPVVDKIYNPAPDPWSITFAVEATEPSVKLDGV